MDADLQHPVELIPQLVAPALGGADLVVASRYADGGGSQWEALRGVISRIAMGVAYVLVPESRRLTDPLSGYFGARVALLAGPLPPGRTYKLLLYLISGQAAGGIVLNEVPFVMARRNDGVSKLVDGSLQFLVVYLRDVVMSRVVGVRRRRRAKLGPPLLDPNAPPAERIGVSESR